MLAVARTLMLKAESAHPRRAECQPGTRSGKEVLAGHLRRLADSGMGVLLVEQKVLMRWTSPIGRMCSWPDASGWKGAPPI